MRISSLSLGDRVQYDDGVAPFLEDTEGFSREWSGVNHYDIAERGVLHRSLSWFISISAHTSLFSFDK